MRDAWRLVCFIGLSLALHAWLFARATDRGSPLDDVLRAVPREVAALGTTVVPLAAPKAPEPMQPAPVQPRPPEPQPAPTEPDAVPEVTAPLPRLTRDAPDVGPDTGAPTTADAPAAEPSADPARPGDDPAVIATPFRSKEDYLAHVLARADRAPKDGTPVPDLVIALDMSDAELRSVIRFYGMKVVAYPVTGDTAPAFYLEFTGDDLRGVERREGRGLLAGFSSRARDLTAHPAFWSRLSRAAAAHSIDPYHARIAAVVPDRIERYFLHKQREAARRVGLALDAVRATHARFRRTNVGWMLDVDGVTPKRGRNVAVTSDPRTDWE